MSVDFWDLYDNDKLGEEIDRPDYASNPWDLVILAGEKIPGISDVECKSERVVDKKKGKGKDGSRLTVGGYQPSEVTIKTKIWSANQWDIYQKIIKKLWTRSGKPPKEPISIQHPKTSYIGISKVQISGVISPKEGGSQGEKMFEIKCTEYFPPGKKSTTKTPKSTIADVAVVDAFLPAGVSNFVLDKRAKDAKNAGLNKPSKTDSGPKGPKPGGKSGPF